MKIVELTDVVNKVHKVCLDTKKYNRHLKKGTLNAYYEQILTSAITDVATLPVTREIQGLEPIEDPFEVTQTFIRVADALGVTFGKPFRQVEADLMKMVEEYPTGEVRLAAFLRHKGKLH